MNPAVERFYNTSMFLATHVEIPFVDSSKVLLKDSPPVTQDQILARLYGWTLGSFSGYGYTSYFFGVRRNFVRNCKPQIRPLFKLSFVLNVKRLPISTK